MTVVSGARGRAGARTPGPSGGDTDADPARPRPVLNPVTRLLWRPDSSLQLELAATSVVVDGPAAGQVRALAGHPTAGTGPADDAEDGVLAPLRRAGLLWDPAADEDASAARLSPPNTRLHAELGALTAQRGEQGAPALQARRHRTVVVRGTGHAGAPVAVLLAAAGVGRVYATDPAPTRLAQCSPGGVVPADEGRSYAAAVADAITRSAPEADTTPLPSADWPDLVVLAYDEPVDPDHRDALHAQRINHLPVAAGPAHGAVGPLVVPGLTSCLHCADLHRLDRDPAWSLLAVQLCAPQRRTPAVSAVLVAATAATAAAQVLAFLDGEQPVVIDGTLEQHAPDWRIRRRSWPPHPDCDCMR